MGKEKEYWSGLKSTIHILVMALAVSGALNLYFAISLVKVAKSRELPIMVSPNIVIDIGSQTYKLLYGEYYINLISTWTSDQYDQLTNSILVNAHPDFAREMEKSLNEAAFQVKENNIKQTFFLNKSTLRIDKVPTEQATWRITATGTFEREVAGIKTKVNKYKYYVDIFYVNGRCFIKRYGHGK